MSSGEREKSNCWALVVCSYLAVVMEKRGNKLEKLKKERLLKEASYQPDQSSGGSADQFFRLRTRLGSLARHHLACIKHRFNNTLVNNTLVNNILVNNTLVYTKIQITQTV